MTTDEIWVRILIYNDCGTEKFLIGFFPVRGGGGGGGFLLYNTGIKYMYCIYFYHIQAQAHFILFTFFFNVR